MFLNSYQHQHQNSITAFAFFALFTSVLFYFLMQSVNVAQVLNITSLSILCPCLTTASAYLWAIVMVPLIDKYALVWSQKLDFNIVVSNVIWLLVLYVPRASLNLNGYFGVLSIRFIIFLIFHNYIIILILNHEQRVGKI